MTTQARLDSRSSCSALSSLKEIKPLISVLSSITRLILSQSLTEPEACLLPPRPPFKSRLVGQLVPESHLSLPQSRHLQPFLIFYVGANTLTQVLMLLKQALFTHLAIFSSPTTVICIPSVCFINAGIFCYSKPVALLISTFFSSFSSSSFFTIIIFMILVFWDRVSLTALTVLELNL